MTGKSAKGKADPNCLQLAMAPTQTEAQAIAHTVLRPTVQAAQTVRAFNGQHNNLHVTDLVNALVRQTELANEGDLTRAESMLTAQAHTLDAIFHALARRAAVNMGEHLPAAETYMRLALKAQAQARATLETLATIKNPPIIFAKQANIAHGHQQVNNGDADPVARGKIETPPTELLEHAHESQRLDTGTPRRAVAGNSSLAAVAAIHRPAHVAGKGRRKP